MSGFHGAFATGVASQQGTLTLPDTWFRPPIWDLLMLQLLRPNSSNLPCLYSTFHLEYPLVLSRFCLWSYSEHLSKFRALSFQQYVSKGITHPAFYGDLVYKLRRVKGEGNFVSPGSKIVKRLRRCQYDPAIIERTIDLVLGPFTALYRSFLKRCTLTNKVAGNIIMKGLV